MERVLKSTLTFEQAAVMQRAAEVFRTADCLARAIALLDAHVRAVERTQMLVDEAIRTMAGRELHPKREGWTIAPHALRSTGAVIRFSSLAEGCRSSEACAIEPCSLAAAPRRLQKHRLPRIELLYR